MVGGNIITAVGMAYKEFAIEVGHKLNFGCDEGCFSGIKNLVDRHLTYISFIDILYLMIYQ